MMIRGQKSWVAEHSGTIFTMLSCLFAAGVSWGACQIQLKTLADDVKEIKTKHREDRDSLIEMQNDIKWIRQSMERRAAVSPKDDPARPAPTSQSAGPGKISALSRAMSVQAVP